jgi:hypothetical protein
MDMLLFGNMWLPGIIGVASALQSRGSDRP